MPFNDTVGSSFDTNGGEYAIMARERDGFPDDRDLAIQADAERLVNFADELTDWVGRHAAPRRGSDFEMDAVGEFQLLRLRRLATNLFNSSKVPVATAVYGPSQTGKSLFMGRVLHPADNRDTPLGKCDTLQPDAYIRELSFDWDINPQSGSNEATALVTRFTTKDRFDKDALPEYPVKIRALSRSEWLRVLARGFRSECPPSSVTWEEGQIRDLFETTHQSHGSEGGNREWQMDLIDTYAYMRNLDHRQYKIDESLFNSFLSQYPLSEEGYIQVAGRLFWEADRFSQITDLFKEVNQFMTKVRSGGRDGILCHWGAVRFMLDSQRAQEQGTKASLWKQSVKWTDFADSVQNGWYILDYKPGGRGPSTDLAIMQSAMLELILPVIPHRLNGDWREVVKKMDILDLPGMRAGGGDAQGRSNTAKTLDERMAIVKRGKVFYLIERYIEERQVQTLLLLIRGGNLEVRQLLKEYVDKWGRTRYGEDVWPQKVQATHPAFFLGMTGIDQEFETRDVNRMLYDNRLTQIVSDTLYEVMTDFGGPERPFTNVFPIRYPGTWDADQTRRQKAGVERWRDAGEIFVTSSMVRKFVRDPEKKWEAAMRDDDGGLSLLCDGFLKCTSSQQKQDALQQQIKEVEQTVRNLARSWCVDPNANLDREKRIAAANKVLAWVADEDLVYDRTHALQCTLCFDEGNAMELAEFAEQRSARATGRRESMEERFEKRLQEFLKEWATVWAPDRWNEHIATHDRGAPWLPSDDFGTFARYLGEYLRSEDVFRKLNQRLLEIVRLQVSDQGARRHVLREYVQLVLNDFVMNPGPSRTPLQPLPETNGHDFGLMTPLLQRWQQRLPPALASAAGKHTLMPSGNDDLNEILSRY